MTELLPARLFAPLALTAIAALGLLLWVLRNGDLCPGQRRRISDGLLSTWAVFGLALMLGVEAAVPAPLLWLGGLALSAGLGSVLYQARLQGKRSLPLSWHTPALALAVLYGIWIMTIMGPAALLAAGAGGCVFAHLIMVRAKHRLQAFNTLLPLVGIASAVGWLLLLLVQAMVASSAAQADMSHLIVPFGQMSAAILLGAITWLLPLMRKEQTRPPVIAVAVLLILGALTTGQGIIWQLSINIS
ncbi:hypothetical protein [Oceanisphaera arctica]|uniref:Uncharacterized protein n=1 Tax=Oceanisphaera arctica TaxID=641510 RepID=A0A2P5TJ86_9GAMM|nr:hypothetical protein [Oceanisphaera arctica]PPL14998.1 hypothetical protein UN63_14055 [Oceanisphaera arctica]GHA22212.1 hypothetical protein GCM10007082_23600 [Oceanisphaera arctica]